MPENGALEMPFEIRRYQSSERGAWDTLVRSARNGVFLFERDHFEYHADRFVDASRMVWHRGTPVALLPAHAVETERGPMLVSHAGLTFGGLVLADSLRAQDTLGIVDMLVGTLRSEGWRVLRIRPVPHIFHRQPSEDEYHAWLRCGARIVRSDLAHTIDLARRPRLAGGRRNALSRARRHGVYVRRSDDWDTAWSILERVLHLRHGIRPAHSVHEIRALAQRFDRISLHGAFVASESGSPRMLAIAVTYAYDGVLHTQYLAACDEGREVGALDAVISDLLDRSPAEMRWLSFGASTYDEGRRLNAGLAAQKEMFGGRPTLLSTLELDLQENAR